MIDSISDCFELSNGVKMPCVGYGTYRTPEGRECVNGVLCALENGYRHIDTASFYANEAGVGEGIRLSGIKRDDIFVTTKVWNDMQGFDNTLQAFEESLKKLNTGYVDLYLVHWPNPAAFRTIFPKALIDTWKALEKLYKEGYVRAIGVCNSYKHHLKPLFEQCEIKPMVNQIEYHPGCPQKEAEEFSKENGLVVEGWAPLCKGRAFGTEPLRSIALRHAKSEAQVLVRWCLQHAVVPLPKSVTPSRIIENADVFDFVLSSVEMSALDEAAPCGRLGSHPDNAQF